MKNWTAALVVASFLVIPTLARAEGGVEFGALGGAVAGSMMGPGDERMEHAVIGAVVGALLGAAIDSEEQNHNNTSTIRTTRWSEPKYVATYPATQYVIAEPVHYRERGHWNRHKHHHHRDHYKHYNRHHDRHNHWRDWD